jgi:photosystem II stability/assembly factor-like uncharacterized protein
MLPIDFHQHSNFVDPTEAFVAKLSPAGSAKVYETSIGGRSWENVAGIAIDGRQNVYVTGTTSSADFPVTGGAFQPYPGLLPAYRTSDAGKTWTGASNGLGVNAFILRADPQGTLYAAGQGGVFKSSDGGESWRDTSAEISTVNRGMIGLAVDPRTPSTLYTSSGQGGLLDPPGATYKSTNGGASWSQISFGEDVYFQGAIWLAVDPSSNVYAVMPWGILKSADRGGTWNSITPGGFASLTVDPRHSSTLYVCSFDSGVWKSDDGGANWATLDGSPPHILRIAVDPANANIVYGYSWDGFAFKSPDGGANWKTVYDGGGGISSLVLDEVDSSIVYLSGTFGVLKSIDGGGSWAATGFTAIGGQLVADPARTGVIYLGAGGGGNDAFVTKLDSNGRAVYSSYLGGSGSEEGRAIAVDAQGAAYVTGITGSADFPIVNAGAEILQRRV